MSIVWQLTDILRANHIVLPQNDVKMEKRKFQPHFQVKKDTTEFQNTSLCYMVVLNKTENGKDVRIQIKIKILNCSQRIKP